MSIAAGCARRFAMPSALAIHDRDPVTGRITGGNGGLTDAQAAFARFYVSGLSQAEAARLAGYASPDNEASRLMRLPHIKAAISAEIEKAINLDGARIAWKTMRELMENEDTSANVRFQAAKWTLEAGGLGLAAKAAQLNLAQHDKPLAEMTVGELERFLAETEARVKAAKVIDIPGAAAPLNGENGVSPLDLARDIARNQAPA